MHSHTQSMRDRSCNSRRGHLEICDGGINSTEKKERVLQMGLEGRIKEVCVKIKCYSTVFNKSAFMSVKDRAEGGHIRMESTWRA